MVATQNDCTSSTKPLYMSYELGWRNWKLAFSVGLGQKPRRRTIDARDLGRLEQEIAAAKKRFGLPEDAPVISCYEAGRDGFWLHRYLVERGVANVVVDSSSIEVNRRKRRAKSDGLDAEKLLSMLMRYHNGDTKVWSVVRVPGEQDEDDRQLHRELMSLSKERTQHINRIRGLLATRGLDLPEQGTVRQALETVRTWDNQPLSAELRVRLDRECQRMELVQDQMNQIECERRRLMRVNTSPKMDRIRQLIELRAIWINSSWLYVMEVFGWREIRNRRQLGSLVGLTPTPYQTGMDDKEQGISKSGNWRMRRMAVEIAWGWLRWQPESELSKWYERRFAKGGKRARRIGIVAMARKLLVQLWRYVETGEVPPGAVFRPTRSRAKAKPVAA